MRKTVPDAVARGDTLEQQTAAELRVLGRRDHERFPTVAEVLVQVRANRDIVVVSDPAPAKSAWPPAARTLPATSALGGVTS
jgi:hypothetical protein